MELSKVEKLQNELFEIQQDFEYIKYFQEYIIKDLDLIYSGLSRENNNQDSIEEIFNVSVNKSEVEHFIKITKNYNHRYAGDIFEIYFFYDFGIVEDRITEDIKRLKRYIKDEEDDELYRLEIEFEILTGQLTQGYIDEINNL